MRKFIITIALTLSAATSTIALTTGCATTGIQIQEATTYSHKCENPKYRYTLTCRAHQMRVRMDEMQKAGRCTETSQRVVEGGKTITRTYTECK